MDTGTPLFFLKNRVLLLFTIPLYTIMRVTYMGVFGLWFSGVFANTVHLVQMICIPLESSDHGRCFYVPFIQTRASPGSSLVYYMLRLFGRELGPNFHIPCLK